MVLPSNHYLRSPKTHRRLFTRSSSIIRRERKQGSHYFKPLSQTILEYASHPEYKFGGEIGLLKRRHLEINNIVHIEKEANNIDDQALDIKKAQMFLDRAKIMEMILALSQKEVEEHGVDRKTFQIMKQRIWKNGTINPKTRVIRRFLAMETIARKILHKNLKQLKG